MLLNRRRGAAAVAGLALLAGGFAGYRALREPEVKVLPAQVLPQVMFTKFRILAPFTHTNNDDPIVAPGVPNASHKHLFFCNPTTNAHSTYASMIAATSNCHIKFGAFDSAPEPGDRAGYWIPSPVINGNLCDLPTAPDDPPACPKSGAVAWYSNPDPCVSARPCNKAPLPVNYTFPRDFRMIAGVGSATSAATNPLIVSDNLFHNCYPSKGRVFGDDDPDGLNQCVDLGGKRSDVWIRFPACWVGRGGDPKWRRDAGGWVIDSPNHRDHVAYPDGDGCPASHPIVLPQLQVQVEFKAVNGTDLSYSSGAWYTLHFDLWNTWDQARLEELTAPSPPMPTSSSAPTPKPTRTR